MTKAAGDVRTAPAERYGRFADWIAPVAAGSSRGMAWLARSVSLGDLPGAAHSAMSWTCRAGPPTRRWFTPRVTEGLGRTGGRSPQTFVGLLWPASPTPARSF